jgi:predicted CoA-binding protein
LSADEIAEILKRAKIIAVVGLSPKEERDSNRVAKYLLDQGYEVVPVNPGQKSILGRTCYKSLVDIPFHVDIANLFINPKRVPSVVDQALEKGADVVWMQLRVTHHEAAGRARENGVTVIMDKCIKQEHEKRYLS